MPHVRMRVTGRVQGVGFRWFVQRCANELGITGWVRNNDDGSVELEAAGEKQWLEKFVTRVRTGPSHASVSGANVTWLDDEISYDEFEIRSTQR